MNPIILIPSRLASTRLPNKPLAEIGGLPMIVQVLKRAEEASVARCVVACDGEEIATAIRAAGGEAVITDPNLPSGSDRIWQALSKLKDGDKHDIIINLQGDMPTIDPSIIKDVLKPLADPKVDIATLAAVITDEAEKTDPAVVKAILSFYLSFAGKKHPHKVLEKMVVQGGIILLISILYFSVVDISVFNTRLVVSTIGLLLPLYIMFIIVMIYNKCSNMVELGGGSKIAQAINFTRITPRVEPMYHHIGIYAYRRKALEKFVSLPPSAREKEEKLEQLRALDAGMRIEVVVVKTVPLGVDTPETLEKARIQMGE